MFPYLFGQCASLRAQLGLLKRQLEETTEGKEKYHSDLQALENRIERSASETVKAVHPQQHPKSNDTANAEDNDRKPSSPSVSGSVPTNWWEFMLNTSLFQSNSLTRYLPIRHRTAHRPKRPLQRHR